MTDEQTRTFKCSVCGADVEFTGALANWAEKNPDKVKCAKCHAAKAGGGARKEYTPKADNSSVKKGFASSAKPQLTAETLRKAYDEVTAAFADVLDDVKDYIGGWTTTVALSKTK
mgnify:CR=1 FL=1